MLERSSILTIRDGAEIIAEERSTLIIKPGVSLNIFGNGKISIKKGGYICIQGTSGFNFHNYTSVIFIADGAVLGANPLLFGSNTSCLANIS